ncbi:protein kinase domain-containing protein [Thiorhodovibrio frisius]|uniref:Serine/threonine protein kinase n=1 Tax=Thiorhodovibrio frisius TaxID=631362 RepID=H8YZY7_9GAMM|nr:protein kinase [Thiorhodovibrio frisius]EIC21160.1 serine/threonine protein kinase [Thiorhodovibrio frisius]WPL23733.1 Serine/threonine-protein kinase PknB [Thiorhodovibrio frisius]
MTTDSAHLCPGCFAATAGANPCPHCGYDEQVPRGPLVLPHHRLLNGQFLVGRVLGRPGGFGITYLAWDQQLHTRVAIKEYLPRDLAGRDMDKSTIAAHSVEDAELFRYGLDQFLREARTLAQLDHPNIVRVRQFFEANGTAYLVMDYYDGVSLAEYLDQQGGKLPEQAAVQLMLPILDGLRAVHAKGFLHRDVKPQNIYLAKTDTGGTRPILLDFGAARQAMGERSRSLSVVVSAGYAPFEQYQRKGQQGPWTDIYSAAAVLYKAVTGVEPPEATERMSADELKPASDFGVSLALSKALTSALAVTPSDRPQTAQAIQDQIKPKDPEHRIDNAPSYPKDEVTPSRTFSKSNVGARKAKREEANENEIPLTDFAQIKGIPEAKVINMIRDGFYIGRLVNGSWFVSKDELDPTEDTYPYSLNLRGNQNGHSSLYESEFTSENFQSEIPVKKFAGLKGLTEAKVIDMIRDGFYEGRLIDGEWFVSKEEIKQESRNDTRGKLKHYKIFISHTGKIEAVKQGWSWPAFCFGGFWAFFKKLWVIGILYFVGFFTLGLIEGALEAEPIVGAGPPPDTLYSLISIGIALLFGGLGNQWREKNLSSKGFEPKDTISAKNAMKAIATWKKTS